MRSKYRAGVSPQPTGEAPKADQHDLLARGQSAGRLVGVQNEPAVVERGNAGVRGQAQAKRPQAESLPLRPVLDPGGSARLPRIEALV